MRMCLFSVSICALGCAPIDPIAPLDPGDTPFPERSARAITPSAALEIVASDGEEGDWFGAAVADAGDLNGDGYGDAIVGAWGDGDDDSQSGAVYVYYGSADGLRLDSEQKITASDAAEEDRFGYAAAAAGDVDGDGYDDVIVGARKGSFYSGHGDVYVYYGGSDGLRADSEQRIAGSEDRPGFGSVVAGAGDLNGDGLDDIVVGVPDVPVVYVYFGCADGVDVASEQWLSETHHYPTTNSFGGAVSGAGDLNGDGYDDLLVGAWEHDSDSGAAFVYYGGAGFGDAVSEIHAADRAPGAQFGWSVSGAGDLDGDGYDDLLVGARGDDEAGDGAGAAYVHYGGPGGVGDSDLKLIAPDIVEDDYFGTSVSGAGDIDGDGYDDLVVGAPGQDAAASRGGAAYVYYGGAEGVDPALSDQLVSPAPETSGWFGESVSGAGDVDGDGFDDLIVGASGTGDAGAAYLFVGALSDADGDGVVRSEDCDDDDPAVGAPTIRYIDADGDGHGDRDDGESVCAGAAGYSDTPDDCDDGDADVHPSAADACGDGIDSDCDGRGGPDDDEDGDGWSWTEEQTHGTDACDADTDGDGLTDRSEVESNGTDPTNIDTDRDGVSDLDELLAGTDPRCPDTADEALGCASRPGAPGGAAALLAGLLGLAQRRRQA